MLAVVTSVAWAATLVALTAVAASQHDTYRLRLWPHWRQLGGGSRPAGWFAAAVQLLAAAPVLLVACFCHAGLQPAVSVAGLWSLAAECASCLTARGPWMPTAALLPAACRPQVRHLRPASAARTRSATAAALAYACALAVLLALCACALFGGGVAADALLELSPDALASLVGEPAGQAAFLLLRLPFLVSIVAGLPLLMGPFR